jgi:MHS family proline/betaine transporter-like MFS transporter
MTEHASRDVRAATRSPGSAPLRAAIAGSVGTFIEFYNFSVYGFMALVIADLYFPGENKTAALLSTLLVLASAWLLKPVGGVVFGHIGDKFGRKPALLAAVLCMGIASFAIGLLPTHSTLGSGATVLLVIARLAQGLSAGGEIAGSVTLISESVPSRKRGFYGAFTPFGSIMGFAVGAAVVGLLNTLATSEQIYEWAWRLPFLTSLPITLMCLWIRKGIVETLDTTVARREKRSTLRRALAEDRPAIARTMALSVATNGTVYIGLAYISIHLITRVGYTESSVYWVSAAVIAVTGIGMLGGGYLADRIGLVRITAWGFVGFAVLTVPAMALMGVSLWVAALCYFAVLGNTILVQTGVFSLVPRLFGPATRYTGVAVGWNMGDIVAGGTAPYIAVWLVANTGFDLSPGLFVLVVSCIGLAALASVKSGARKDKSPQVERDLAEVE